MPLAPPDRGPDSLGLGVAGAEPGAAAAVCGGIPPVFDQLFTGWLAAACLKACLVGWPTVG